MHSGDASAQMAGTEVVVKQLAVDCAVGVVDLVFALTIPGVV